uniref:Uncharacterized protein n=1 Tax=Timema shepardi TaxID=629360 RepID=A0A7R9G758_TIMSH|nr:unnamed protein product [Timema shepardi]
MKRVMLVVLLMVMSSVLSNDLPDPDNFLSDDNSVTQYVNCLLEKDICPPGIQEFKVPRIHVTASAWYTQSYENVRISWTSGRTCGYPRQEMRYVDSLDKKCDMRIAWKGNDIPEELKTSCETCAPSKRKFIRKTSTYLMKERPEVWKKIVERYDATGKYMDNFLKFLKSDD